MFYEDFRTTHEFELGKRTVSEADIEAFARLSGDHNPMHSEGAPLADSAFGGQVAHGVLGIAMATGLLSQAGLTRGSLVALVGLSWTFKSPVRPGDSLSARLVVAELTDTKDPGRGLVRFTVSVTNQRGEVVQRGELVELVKRRGQPDQAVVPSEK